jgi:hypothetical protein
MPMPKYLRAPTSQALFLVIMPHEVAIAKSEPPNILHKNQQFTKYLKICGQFVNPLDAAE